MKYILAVCIIVCILQNATSSALDGYVAMEPDSKVYFHSIKNGSLLVGPKLSAEGPVSVCIVDGGESDSNDKTERYSVLKSGVLVPKHDDIGKSESKFYKSRASTFYVKAFKGVLVPINVLCSKSKESSLVDQDAVDDRDRQRQAPVQKDRKRKKATEKIQPDRTCNGEITLFLLRSDGVLTRLPPDPYLPIGLKVSYTVNDHVIRPSHLGDGGDTAASYTIGRNGDLIPNNHNVIRADEGGLVSYILGECGSLVPVHEERTPDNHINYYYNGQVIVRSQQFPAVLSNSQVVVVRGQKTRIPGKEQPKKHSIHKRSLYAEDFVVNRAPSGVFPVQQFPPVVAGGQGLIRQNVVPMIPQHQAQVPRYVYRPPPPPPPPVAAPVFDIPIRQVTEVEQHVEAAPPKMRVRTDLFVEDDRGTKIPLIPEITEQNDVVLYKLTCKGNLVRFPPCKEPEFGFDIHFQLLLNEFVLVPITKCDRQPGITYTLQENGDLIPLKTNENTFKKAPGSLLYFMLGKNNVLFPVQQKVDPDGCLSFFYQDFFLLKLPSTANKPLHFSTLSKPLFAFFNGITMITCSSKPRLNPSRGSNWKSHSPARNEVVSKDIFLSGPNGQLIRVAPYKLKSGSTVIYEMDSNGIIYRSPKDKKRCIVLKSYVLLREGILLPSNDTTGYMYMTSKNGDMFPYLYPDGKLEAPPGESLMYLLCEKGILLPIELEIVDSYICYFFHDVVVYKERVYCKDGLGSLTDSPFNLHYSKDCDADTRGSEKMCKGGLKPLMTKAGKIVYYERACGSLKRHPSDIVPPCLSYTMGSFEIQPDGSLFQIPYQDPEDDVINLMLEPNGDLTEDSRNRRKPESMYYILDVNGNLVAVDGRKTRKSIYLYKNHVKVCKIRLADDKLETSVERLSIKKTPLGRDPLRLMDDPEPIRPDGEPDEPHSMCIPVPLKSVVMPSPDEILRNTAERHRCDGLKETMALELEINDDVIEEIKKWAAKCDKLLSRREVEQSLSEALQGLNVTATAAQVQAAEENETTTARPAEEVMDTSTVAAAAA